MKTDKPFSYEGADIIYPDKVEYVHGELYVDNYLPDVLRRGLRGVYSVVSRLEPNLPYQVWLRGEGTQILQQVTENGLASRLGLPDDDTKAVHRTAIELSRIVSAEVGQEAVMKQRIALLGYAAVAECQMFGDANKRVGRVIYGRIQHGYEPDSIKRGIDAVLDDEVPPDIEKLVLLQNTARCSSGIEPAVTEFGGVYIPPDLAMAFDRQREILDRYRYVRTNEKRTTSNFDRNISQLTQQLDNVLDNTKLACKTASVLIQEEYGPAAWLLCCKDMKLDDITPDIACELVATSTRLLQMRIIVLLNAIANGGKFVEIIDSEDESMERRVRVSVWTPTEVSSE